MTSAWRTDTGFLACRWSEFGGHLQPKPLWMREIPEMQSGHLCPLPDFAAHSPFGGPSWFEPDLPRSAE